MDMMEMRFRMMAMLGGADVGLGIFEKMEVKSLTILDNENYPGYAKRKTAYTINHNLGEVPNFVLMYPKARYIPPIDTQGSNIRVIQYAYYFGIGSKLYSGTYETDSTAYAILYTNSSNSKYEQYTPYSSGAKNIINNLTSSSIQILDNSLTDSVIKNNGIISGDYWIVIGKIANAYKQGEQVEFS